MDLQSSDDSQLDLYVLKIIALNSEGISIEHHEVRDLSGFQRSTSFFIEG